MLKKIKMKKMKTNKMKILRMHITIKFLIKDGMVKTQRKKSSQNLLHLVMKMVN